jgi:predicted permease
VPLPIRPRVRRAFRLALRRRDLTDAEIDEELRFHVEMRVAQLMARGLTRDEAGAEARRRFGASWDDAVSRLHDAGNLREERLAMRERLDAIRHDLAYAARTLVRQPGFAIVVVLTFALGIGANVTMFGVIDRLLLQPPPHVTNPGELVQVGITSSRGGEERFVDRLHYPLYTLMRADTVAFGGVAITTSPSPATLGRGASAEEILTALVNAEYFAVLGARPSAGRFFLPEEDRDASGHRVVVLSHGFWQRRFGGDRAVFGKSLQIGADNFTVVGAAPPGFTGVEPKRVDAWIPIGGAGSLRFVGEDWATNWGSYWLQIYGRLRPAVRADVAVDRIGVSYAAAYDAYRATNPRARDRERPRFRLRSILPAERLEGNAEANVARLLAAVAGLVLLIACANVANLMLARGGERRREIAVRLALGVSRARLLRLLLVETAVLAAIGGVVAVLVAVWGMRLVRATLLADFAWASSAFDGRVLGITLLLVLATTLLAGFAPALRASRPNVTEALKAGGREGSVQHSRLRTSLMVFQAAVAVVLVVGAGLFVHSLRQVAALRLGYEPERVIAATVDLAPLGYQRVARTTLFATMRDRVVAMPGVASASTSATHPLHGWGFGMRVRVPGRDSLPEAATGGPYYNTVGADYFATLGLRLVEGRPITAEDVSVDARVAVLSEPMARAYWPRQRAVGRCIMLGSDSACTTVVGVASDAREQVGADEERFLIYVPLTSRWGDGANVLLVRARGGDPARLVAPIRTAMQMAAPNLPYANVQPLADLLAPQVRPWKMGATLFALFGLLALLIAAVGLYSAISYGVTQRGHEFGVRMALGAQAGDVVGLVMGQGVRAAVMGVVAGTVVSLLAGRFVADLLFQTSPRNPVVFASVAALILAVAAAASFVPAWRAARVHPVRALRGE